MNSNFLNVITDFLIVRIDRKKNIDIEDEEMNIKSKEMKIENEEMNIKILEIGTRKTSFKTKNMESSVLNDVYKFTNKMITFIE